MRLRGRLQSPLTLMLTLEWFMDLVAFAALYATGEVMPMTWGVCAGLFTVRLLFRFRLATRHFAAGFFALIGLTLFLMFKHEYHPLIAIVQTVPVLHGLVVLSREKDQYRGWRIGVGFTELTLAAAMTPDFTLPILTFLFVLSAIALISCKFVVEESRKTGADEATLELPTGFHGWIFRQGIVIFVTSALIFPLLPRISQRGNSSSPSGSRTTGYTEEVTLSHWTGYSEGSSAPVVRIIAERPGDIYEFLYKGLLRSKVLNEFDGTSWKQRPKLNKTSLAYVALPKQTDRVRLQFQREPLQTAAIPVPYGYTQVRLEQYGYSWVPERNAYQEVQEARYHQQSVKYQVSFVPNLETRQQILFPKDTPTAVDTELPEAIRSSRFKRVAENLFRGITDPRKKVEAVGRLFMDQKFIAGEELSETAKNLYDPRLSPLENFFFRTREGHCELFSSAAATLLRLGGVPARVIAGFRVTRDPVGNILTVRMSDAHAWVEVYYPEHGWFPMDPTPRILLDLSVLDWVRDGYDWLSANWSQHVLNYGEDSNLLTAGIRSLRKNVEKWSREKSVEGTKDSSISWEIPIAFLGGALLIGIVFFTRKRLTNEHRSWQGTPALRRQRLMMERFLRSSAAAEPSLRQLESYRRWQEIYRSARFGRAPEEKSIAELDQWRRRLHEESRRPKLRSVS